MARMLPPSRPQWSRDKVEAVIASMCGQTVPARDCVLVGLRGYYRDSMGVVGKNDRRIYDDAIFVVSPEAFVSFNGNTDPSVTRRGVSVLDEGVHPYRKGRHGISRGPGYPALRPATKNEALPVHRDGQGASIGYCINIHKGGYGTTSSLGCQTIHPTQWNAFIALVYAEMKRSGQREILYVLKEVQG